MATTSLSPLQRERSIEVIPRSVSASSELSYALLEERSRSARSAREGLATLSNNTNTSPVSQQPPPMPILKNPLGGGSVVNNEGAAQILLPKRSPGTEVTNEVLTSTDESSSSEKENEANKDTKKRKKKIRKGFIKMLRPKHARSKPPKSPLSKKKSKRSTTGKTKLLGEAPKSDAMKQLTSVKKSFESKEIEPFKPVPQSFTMESPDPDDAILEKARKYTQMSTSLLDSLKNDGGTGDDINESIKQAKLAYQYAMKARELYGSVGGRTRSGSVAGVSVGSSHITEKAGNISGLAPVSSRAETPQSSLLLDSKGNEMPEDSVELSPSSIEIEHDGRIRFEAPVSANEEPMDGTYQENGIDDMLQIASSFQSNQELLPESPPRPLSPLSAILGSIKQESISKNSSAAATAATSIDDTDAEQGTPKSGSSTDISLIKDKSVSKRDGNQTASQFDKLDVIQEEPLKRSKSEIIHPPALEPFRSSLSPKTQPKGIKVATDTESIVSENTTPSQALLIHHRENRLSERMKEMQHQRTTLAQVLTCSAGLTTVEGGTEMENRPQQTSGKGSARITVVNEKEEYEIGRAARHEHKPKSDAYGTSRPTIWKEGITLVRSSSKAAKEWTREEYDTLKSQLNEATALAEEILSGKVDVVEEVNPFVCSSGGPRVKPAFEDDITYMSDSDESQSLLEGPTFTDDEEQTYETLSVTLSEGSILDTVGSCSISAEDPHEGFEVFEKSDEWEATFDEEWKATFDEDWKETFDNSAWKEALGQGADDSSSDSGSSYGPREMTVLAASSTPDDVSLSDSSDASSVSSMSNES